jgi:putative N-acetylmannosamine-6-phosphate epimerase
VAFSREELKAKVQRDLEHPWTKRSGDLAESRAEDIGVRIGKVHTVEDIECVHAKFRVQPIVGVELEVLGESEVRIGITGAADGIAA